VESPGNLTLGADAARFAADTVVSFDANTLTFPPGKSLKSLPAGEYAVRAAFVHNPDLSVWNAPGNRYCDAQRVTVAATGDTVLKLTLDKVIADEMPKDTATVKYHKLPSKRLSEFHGRPMFTRIGVVLPEKFAAEPDKRYGLVVRVGGFGGRFTSAGRVRPDPRFVQLVLDGAGPLGDPYQVNSANHGPYGDVLVSEVIPFVEKEYRGLGKPEARFTTGGSTGGWVSLALQVFYPDTFNGCWAQCPDGVDFRGFQLIDVTADANAYVNRYGFERASKRTVTGETVYTIRHEVQMERVRGLGGRWELSGEQWASWNATYGPKGKDGKPVPLWDGETGAIDREAAKQWEKYDLRLVLERNWKTLGPKLAGKIHVWVGDADDYFLNNAVHLLRASLARQTDPQFDGVIEIEPRKGHTSGWSNKRVLDEMAARGRLK
jgi:hypothetical protein